jgi:hypothetical protein
LSTTDAIPQLEVGGAFVHDGLEARGGKKMGMGKML